MKDSTEVDAEALSARAGELRERYEAFRGRGLALDMTRGKPCPEQLDLANGLLDAVGPKQIAAAGNDPRNYGGADGLPEAKTLFAEYMGVAEEELILGGNSSLNMMHDLLRDAWVHGFDDGDEPWGRLPEVKFLCPSPGYDRHFTICEYFRIEMMPVAMTAEGPDMDEIERLAAADPAVRGMWCVPKYSNPTGVTFSGACVQRLATMDTAAPDFRILWDNAYAVHDLAAEGDRLENLLAACKAAGNGERAVMFGSTSKVSFAGAGVAMMAASERNIEQSLKRISTQSIGPDKVNQLRHLRFFGDMAGVLAHMRRHAEIIRPKFEAVLELLDTELGGLGIAEWSRPRGGYFISLDTLDGCARRTVELAREAGVRVTPAGATFPYGRDPCDRNIRLAPTFPPEPELRTAAELLAVCVQLAAIERLEDTAAA